MNLKDTNRRRIAGAGVAGFIVLALGVGVMAPAIADAQTDAVMVSAPSTVTDAVASAEAQHQQAVAAAEAHEQQVSSQQQQVVDLALAQEGDAYSMGASGPSVFDCSGLVMWVYETALGVSLPHNTHAQWDAIADTWYVGEKEPQPGDVVFFFENGADHVGIYIGDGMMISAENPGSGVQVAPIYSGYWAQYLTGFGRVIQ